MTERDLPDLIHLKDDLGNSVVLRLTEIDPEGRGISGVIEVGSTFVSGQTSASLLLPDDLDDWETVLDDLARGDNTAWLEGKRATEIWLELTEYDELRVSVVEEQGAMVTVELTITPPEDWLDDHYDRLDRIRKLLPE